MKKTHVILAAIAIMVSLIFTSCTQRTEVIDLDKVLDIMQKTLDELNTTVTDTTSAYGDVQPDTIQPLSTDNIKPEFDTVFLDRFAANLNGANLTKDTIGVSMLQDGSVEGYRDSNTNKTKDPYEKSIFKVELDTERNRLIATDTQNQYRRSSGYSMAHGLFAGYFLSSMLGRQRHAGITPSRFANMKMSDNNYRKSSSSRTSARTKSGSRSFKSGK